MTHELKTWPDYYEALVDGRKTFEYRRNDRGFQVGDVLHLREWDSTFEQYTGRQMWRTVSYILPVSGEFVVMALGDIPATPPAAGAYERIVDRSATLKRVHAREVAEALGAEAAAPPATPATSGGTEDT